MDKVFSTRLDEKIINKINLLVKNKSITKKALIEKAVQDYMKKSGFNMEHNVIEQAFGAWDREETAEEVWRQSRKDFNRGFFRYSKKKEQNK